MGQRENLSEIDQMKINKLYKCQGQPVNPAPTTGGGFWQSGYNLFDFL